jgi:chromosome segregation ATPase
MPSPLFPRSPRTSSLKVGAAGANVESDAQIATLRARVTELEKALTDADKEMQDVVGRMSAAQIEVMTLQEEREAAVRETRKLQRVLEDEKVKAHNERFKTLTTSVK